ncbi:nuclear transport factor 2 family protein [Sphingosinicella sp.]|uniref:nuclear transport factor 2 family protein n=1 Tax=Sphingosinicella sp. TaxID=1917971 RepID=UPI004037C04A
MLLALVLAALQPAAVTLPDAAMLRTEIAARDAELFDVLFNRCEPERMRALVTPDLEFYHDRDGVVRGADRFVSDYRRFCTERQAPDAWRSRRALVPESLVVDPVPGVGAIEAGEHLFYERRGEGPERLVGRARFAQLWVRAPDGWRLSRVLSYSHDPAGE